MIGLSLSNDIDIYIFNSASNINNLFMLVFAFIAELMKLFILSKVLISLKYISKLNYEISKYNIDNNCIIVNFNFKFISNSK